jgi:hypothetical protein
MSFIVNDDDIIAWIFIEARGFLRRAEDARDDMKY